MPTADHPTGDRVLRGATLIDGTGAEPLPDATVVIRQGRIEAVGPGDEVAAPADLTTRDLTGRWLIPGLIDAHVHADTDAHLASLLAAGVTAIRNPAAPLPARQPGPNPQPRPFALTAGPPIDHPPVAWPGATAVTTEAETRTAVREQALAGVDLIKLYVRLPPPLVRAAVDEAHLHGLPVLGDLVLTSWDDAARAGIDFLSHATPLHPSLLPEAARATFLGELPAGGVDPLVRWYELMDPEGPELAGLVATLAEHDVVVDPTLVAVRARLQGATDPDRALAVWPRVLALVRRLHAGGVRLIAGTDAPRPGLAPGESLHHELRLLTGAGLTPMQTLCAATGHSATALGLNDTLGTLRPGRRADLLVLSTDPLAAPVSTASIVARIIGGRDGCVP